ncbi:BrnT family toxin [Candidatus Roizmanbacteria bacterium]|nr:BrnT family toxin [Candidatus Roizmanbacteria bacterium]
MKTITIKKSELIWDEWNVKHIEKHKVKRSEVKQVLKRKYVARETYKERVMIIGTSGDRILSIVLAKEQKGYYVVTARDASKKERRIFRNEKNSQIQKL